MTNQSPAPKIVTKKHVARLERERRQVALVRTVAIVMIAVVALLLVYGYLDLNFFQLHRPVAEVNGEVITTIQWQERVQFQRINLVNLLQTYQFYQQNFGMDTSQQQQEITSSLQLPEVLGQQVLDLLIDEALIRQEAKRRGITVSQEEVEKAMQKAYGFFPDGTPTPTTTPTPFDFPTLSPEQLIIYPATSTPTEAFTPTSAPTSTPDFSVTPTATSTNPPPTPTFVPEAATLTPTPYTLDVYKSNYAKKVEEFKGYGISEASLRSTFENSLLRDKVLESITADLPNSEEQVWARHILVSDEETANTVRSLLLGGKDFAEVAKQYSQDTGSGANGGDLGWQTKNYFVAEFSDAAFSQKVGEIGMPVKTQYGYHIIQVIDRQELPLSASQYEQNRQTAFTDWLDKTHKESAILTYDTWRTNLPPMPDFATQ